ncbi:DUF3987 domain-containing protein [Robiginitalea aurantiaca]|uniref:DUF3987 domain-containing protein n=1 Tax=Robiginitalea aurantiaca TaxID=3056915 RepID=A0ABT7WBF8_9FLAO|nr:DUF3987 domain-containing protein [Robiginitalea aurantiaca]MDM9630255.1 DUF3987 domain-containing protein [Robiginitalea aurantiaca]
MSGIISGFPTNIFPDEIQALIENASKTVGFNPDFLSAGILSVVATATGNTLSIFNGSYYAKPILWLSIIGRPGTGKSHPLQFAKKPIEKMDSKSFREYQAELKEYEKQEKDKSKRKPYYSKFILKDFTPEKLAEALQYNDKGILIFQDELMRWINSFDRYKKGGDQQMYLDMFNGSELTVDRVTKEPIRIEETNVNILGGMQPEILKSFVGNNRRVDGFLDRFLFVYPDNLKPILFTGNDIASEHVENYFRLIDNIMTFTKSVVHVNSETIKVFTDWQHTKAKEAFNDHIERAIQSKLETYLWRLALIIEVMSCANECKDPEILSQNSLEKAIQLVEYFRHNTLKVHDRIMTLNPLEGLTRKQLDIYEKLPQNFKRSDVLELFESNGFSISSADRFLKKDELFFNRNTKLELNQGEYQKKIKT